MPRAKPTPACSERKSILRALFIHFLWGQMLSPKAIISGMALITAEAWEQAKHWMERWRSLLSCGLHQEPSQTSWNTSPAVPLQLPCGHPKYSPTYLSLLLTELVPADIMTGRHFARMTARDRTWRSCANVTIPDIYTEKTNTVFLLLFLCFCFFWS